MAKPQYTPQYYKTAPVVQINEFHKHEPNYRGSIYLSTFVIPGKLRRQIDLTVRALRPHLDKFDAIAFTGMSGALIGPPVAMVLGKEIIMVRKDNSGTHSIHDVEGDFNARAYIIVDDLRDTGATERFIIKKIADNIPDAKYVGFMSAMHLREIDVEAAETFNEPIPLLPRKLDSASEYVGVPGTVPFSRLVEKAKQLREGSELFNYDQE